jgi:hypothetical protein
MASSTGFLDIINPWNWSSKRRITGNDDSFVDALKLYPDLWRDVFISSNIICCPVSGSLKDGITEEQLLSHVLVQQRTEGEYRTLRGEHVHLSGSDLIFDNNVDEPRTVKVISRSETTDSNGNSATVFRISRPLLGGIVAPEDSDQISMQAIFKYLTVLRSFPEAESTFMALDDYIKEINFVGSKSLDGFSRIKPSLTISLRLQWKRATDKLCRCKNLVATLGNSVDVTRRLIGQIIESYLMHSVADTVYPWVCVCNAEKDKSIYNYMQTLRYHTQSDLGIASTLQCNQADAVKRLGALHTADTPVGKLIILKRVVQHIRTTIDRNIRRKFPCDDIELATDDIVLLIIWCLLQLSFPSQNSLTPGHFTDPLETENTHDRTFLSDLNFAVDFHFNASSSSELGFTLCHFQVASDWLTSRARAFSLQRTTAKLVIDIDLRAVQTVRQSAFHSKYLNEYATVQKEKEKGENVLVPGMLTGNETTEESKFNRGTIDKFGIQNNNNSSSSSSSGITPHTEGTMTPLSPSSNTLIQKHGNNGVNNTESVPPNLGFEYFDGSCIIATEQNLDWIADIRRQHRVVSIRSLDGMLGDDSGGGSGSGSGGNSNYSNSSSSSSGSSSAREDVGVGVGNSSAHTHGTIYEPLGRTINIVGHDLHSSPHTQPRVITIKSDRTNKVGGVVMVAGSCGVYAAVNEDGHVFTWGAADSGRLGRGTYVHTFKCTYMTEFNFLASILSIVSAAIIPIVF